MVCTQVGATESGVGSLCGPLRVALQGILPHRARVKPCEPPFRKSGTAASTSPLSSPKACTHHQVLPTVKQSTNHGLGTGWAGTPDTTRGYHKGSTESANNGAEKGSLSTTKGPPSPRKRTWGQQGEEGVRQHLSLHSVDGVRAVATPRG